MNGELGNQMDLHRDLREWALGEWDWAFRATIAYLLLGFRQRFSAKLEHLGDAAMDAQQYDEAVSHYSSALSLDPPSPQGILIKRSKAYLEIGSWERVVDDANQVRSFSVQLYPVYAPSPGYRARSIVTMGLRDEACSITQCRRLRKCNKSI